MSNPLVSVIIPCFNAARWISEAIDSALGQTYAEREVIVVDDGSTDDSLRIIQSYGDRVRWVTGPNRGGCAARNTGIELARGEFIQFLDADDGLFPHKLERQVPVMLSGAFDVVSCEWCVSNDLRKSKPSKPRDDNVIPIADPLQWALSGELIGTASPLHRKDILERLDGFRIGLPCAQEYDLHVRLAAMGYSLGHIRNELHWHVRRVEGSVSSNYVPVLKQQLGIYREARRLLESRSAYSDHAARLLAAACLRTGIRLFHRNEKTAAHEVCGSAFEFHRQGGVDYYDGRPLQQWCARWMGPLAVERVRALKKKAFA